ncbi:SAV_6107 family HEPN domain-containing protein [Modestobacter lacusdianchii]
MGAARALPAQGELPLPPPLPTAAAQLLGQAHRGLGEAAACPDAGWRYATAHLAALRAAAAVLAARTQPEPARRRPRSAWVLIGQVAPELGEWAAFFAAGAAKRAAAEAGLSHAVTEREADDLVRDVRTFLGVVETAISRPVASPPRLRAVDPGSRRRGSGRTGPSTTGPSTTP